jgi:hypothetical protein
VASSPLSAVLGVCLLCLCVLVQNIRAIYILRELLLVCPPLPVCLTEREQHYKRIITTKKLVPCVAKIPCETTIFEIEILGNVPDFRYHNFN